MLTINVIGGLGNQMFQIALCEAMRQKGIEAALDLSQIGDYIKDRNWDYAGSVFNVKYPVNNINKLIWRLRFHLNKCYTEHEDGIFDRQVFSLKNKYLYGYWQSYKYFDFCPDSIRRIFTYPEDKLNSETKTIATQIKNTPTSISLHIRLGDYLQYPEIFGGICTEEYYDRAIAYFKEKYHEPKFFVFSNDKDYIKKYLNDSSFIVVDCNNDKNAWQDMYLMSQCNHNIIANSSFSWWGAYLNQNEEQEVVAPKKWLNTYEMKDICPNEWMRI